MAAIEWSELVAHLTGFAHLATVDGDGEPHVSKVAPAIDGETILIATRASSRKARNVAATGQAAVMWEPAAEAYVHAAAEIIDGLDEKRRLWDAGLFAFPLEGFFGSPDNDDFVFLRLTPTRATLMVEGASGIERRTWRR